MGEVPAGGVAVRVLEGSIFETRASGYISREVLHQSAQDFERLLDETAGIPSLLIDTTDIDAFEPGLPAVSMRWLGKNRARIGRIAFVAQRPLLVGVLHAIIRLLGSTSVTLHATRDEALAALRRRPSSPPRRIDSANPQR